MSEREPITAELRELMGGVEPRVDEDGVVTAKYVTPEAWGEFAHRCDAIDAVHAGLERENAELRQRVSELDKRGESIHDCGRITGELRAWWVRKFPVMDKELHKDFTAIADRIDAEHEAKVSYWQGASYKDGYDEGFASADDWLGQHEDAMAEHGWIRLPLDVDGEVVRIGDVMVMASHPFGCEDKPLVVDRMELSRGMHGEVWCLALDTDRSCWTQAAVLRHHHAPTVEDVLREMADRCYADEDEPRDRDAIVAEYAAKLRLAGDAS